MVDSMVVFWGHSVIPSSHRHQVIDCLHSGHQGVTSMVLRAKDNVWWPGMFEVLKKTREYCKECTTDAPFKPNAPQKPLPDMHYPFQQLCGDYMEVDGASYLVLVDR